MRLGWERREPPLAPVAVVGRGSVTGLLAAAVRDGIGRGGEYRIAAAPGFLVVWSAELPWADGAVYLGRDGGLLMPTTRRTTLPAVLWRDRLLGSSDAGKIVVLLDDQALISEPPQRPADLACLQGLVPS